MLLLLLIKPFEYVLYVPTLLIVAHARSFAGSPTLTINHSRSLRDRILTATAVSGREKMARFIKRERRTGEAKYESAITKHTSTILLRDSDSLRDRRLEWIHDRKRHVIVRTWMFSSGHAKEGRAQEMTRNWPAS